MMELRTLRYFLAVCREGNMSRAAERLHVSQPTLSRQIADLERQLGRTLLIRHSRSVEPTEEGIYLMRRAADIVELADTTEETLRQGDDVVEGSVSIAAGESAGMSVVAKCIRRFRESYPQVRFCLHSGNADYVIERLERGLDDFAVLMNYPGTNRYEHLRLEPTDAWGVLMQEGDALSELETVHPADLEGRHLIASDQALETGVLADWLGEHATKAEVAATYTLGYNATHLVREGVGLMLILDGIVSTGKGTGLEFRPLWPPVISPIELAWRRDATHTRAAQLFLEAMQGIR